MDRQDYSDSAAKTHVKDTSEYYKNLPYCDRYQPSHSTLFFNPLDPDFEKNYNMDSLPVHSYRPSLDSFCPERFRAKPIPDDPEPVPDSSLPKPKPLPSYQPSLDISSCPKPIMDDPEPAPDSVPRAELQRLKI